MVLTYLFERDDGQRFLVVIQHAPSEDAAENKVSQLIKHHVPEDPDGEGPICLTYTFPLM